MELLSLAGAEGDLGPLLIEARWAEFLVDLADLTADRDAPALRQAVEIPFSPVLPPRASNPIEIPAGAN
jgi:hypothetical protein